MTFTPGPAQSSLLTGAVRKGVLGATVRCQTLPGTTCSGRLKLTARVTRVKRTRHGKAPQHEDDHARDALVQAAGRRPRGADGAAREGDPQARAQVPHQARDADAHADRRRRDEDDAEQRAVSCRYAATVATGPISRAPAGPSG